MRLVDQATFPPGRCAISGETSGPFVDTGFDMPGGGRVYLSVRALVHNVAPLIGLVPRVDVEAVCEERDALKAIVGPLQARQEMVLAALEKMADEFHDLQMTPTPAPEPTPAPAKRGPGRPRKNV